MVGDSKHGVASDQYASGPTFRRDQVRRATWGRLSREHAELLAREIGGHPRSVEERVARARAWMVMEVYEPAWNELKVLEAATPKGRLRARILTDLLLLSYYLARDVDETEASATIETEAGGEPTVLADLHLGLANRAIARNDAHAALRHLYVGMDLAKLNQEDARGLLALLRVRAHVLAQAGCYREAQKTAEEAMAIAEPLDDDWEIGRCSYTTGFALWCQGRALDAIVEFDQALARTKSYESPFRRWIRCSRARALAMLGRTSEADEDLAASSLTLPEDIAYLAIARGDPSTAAAVLAIHATSRDPFVVALTGIAGSLLGSTESAQHSLSRAQVSFASGGLHHYALSTQIHLAYCSGQLRHGAGASRAKAAATSLTERGATSFAWPHKAIVGWVRRVTGSEPALASFARSRPDDPGPMPLVQKLREIGLTPREAEIATHLDTMAPTRSRKELAKQLGISPHTLRVHLMRMRSKLDLTARGDVALRSVLEHLRD